MSFLGDFETSLTSAFYVAGSGAPSAYLQSVQGAIQGTFKNAFIAGFVVWVMLIGYEVAYGKTEDGITFLLTKIGRIFLIGAFAFEGYPMVEALFIGLQQDFVQTVGNGLSGATPTISSLLDLNIINPLEAMSNSIVDGLRAAFSTFTFPMFGQFFALLSGGLILLFAFFALWAICMVICVVSMAMYFAALASFYILLTVGPFFLLCLCFPFTQKFFETWVGGVITATLAMMFTALLTGLVANILGLGAAPLTSQFPVNPPPDWFDSTGSLPGVLLGKAGLALLVTYLYFKVFDMASSLGGGMNMGSNVIGAMRQLSRLASGGKGAGAGAGASSAAGGALAGPTARAQALNSAGRSAGRAVGYSARSAARIGSGAARAGAYAYNRGISAVRSLGR